jgi:pyruvate ferredoxin oxidoreductase delta subunit
MKLKSVKEINEGWTLEAGSSLKNKTGNWSTFIPVIDKKKCIKCGKCVMNCPDICIEMKEKGLKINYEFCKGCGICSNTCPVKGIKMVKK